ncbi:MAG: hypothetical protein U0R17_03850 [Acidimicrobiia bacterium]
MLTLANEVIEKTTWYPLMIGWIVVLAGIGMFFGSTYLLLSTNLGSRLGFLVVGSIVSGFIVILSLLWLTTATPLNVFKGRQEAWKAVGIVQDVKSSNIEAVKTIKEKGSKLTSTEYANVKAAADTLLAAPKEGEVAPEKPESIANDLPKSTVIVNDIYEVGGSEPNPLHFEFRHTPKYAAAYYCQLDKEKFDTAFRSTCDKSDEAKANSKVLLLEKDLGSLRQPPLFLFLGSSVLFAIFLLSMHWREKDLSKNKTGNDSDDEDAESEKAEKELVDA